MTTRSKLITVTLATVLLALAGLTLALAVSDSSADDTGPPSAGQTTDPRTAFAVFRRDARPGDAMPLETRRMFGPLAEREGLDLDHARAVAPGGRGYVYAVPGPDKVCLGIPDPVDGYGMSCQNSEGALDGRLWVGLNGMPSQREGDVRMAILAPDGIEAVMAVDEAGNRRAISVTDNVAFADLQHSASVEYEDADGTHSVLVPGTPEQFVVQE